MSVLGAIFAVGATLWVYNGLIICTHESPDGQLSTTIVGACVAGFLLAVGCGVLAMTGVR